MKRDLDLLRDILICIENQSGVKVVRMYIFKDLPYDHELIAFHVRLLMDAGYIDANEHHLGEQSDFVIRRLTFAGCFNAQTFKLPCAS